MPGTLGATSDQGTHVTSNQIRVRILVALLAGATSAPATSAMTRGDAAPELPPMRGGALAKPVGELAPADFDDGTGGGGSGPGGPGGDVQRLAQYLRMRVQQSYDRTFQDAYYILESGARAALQGAPEMPVAFEACLRGALRGAHQADSYKDAWRQLHNTMRRLGDHPQAFTGYGYSRLRACLMLARESSWEQTFRNGFVLIRDYLQTLQSRPELFQGFPMYALAAESAYEAGSRANEYDDGWRMIDRSLAVLVESQPIQGPPVYFRAALEGSYQNSFENGYRCLDVWAARILSTGMLGEWERLELLSSLRSARRASRYDDAYRILRDSMSGLAANAT